MTLDDCLFCKIVRREIPGAIVLEDDRILAFKDINPRAPTHILVIPKRHYRNVLEVPPGSDVMDLLIQAAARIAREGKIAEKGFRLTINTNDEGGQTVPHLHLHLLAGRQMTPSFG